MSKYWDSKGVKTVAAMINYTASYTTGIPGGLIGNMIAYVKDKEKDRELSETNERRSEES